MLHETTYYQVNAVLLTPDPKTDKPRRSPDDIVPIGEFEDVEAAKTCLLQLYENASNNTRFELVEYKPHVIVSLDK